MSSPSHPPLRQTLEGGVLAVTLDRPAQGNTLTAASIESLHVALERAELDASVRVVVLRGAGEDFCLGIDPDELLASTDAALADNERDALRLALVFRRCRALPKPLVAVVRGRALGDGVGLVLSCDLAVAAESAVVGCSEIRRGALAATTLPLLRRATGEKQALDLALSGRQLSASEALAAGIVTRVVPDADFDREVAKVTSDLVDTSASALALTKQLFYQSECLSLHEALELGARTEALARSAPDFRAAAVRFLRR